MLHALPRMRARSSARVVLAFLALVTSAAVPAGASAQTAGGLAITRVHKGVASVYAVNADGSGVRPLMRSPGAAYEGSPAYSPDGRRIAYTCGNFELCVMNSDGSAPARLTTNPWPTGLIYDTSAAWSPDGTTIAFVHTVGGLDGISLVKPDGSGLRQLPVPAGINGNPAFSPDSKLLAFDHATDETGNSELPSSSDSAIYVIGVDGSAPHAVTAARIDAGEPSWSPDGAHIAFSRDYEEANSQIVVMNADGGGQRRLTSRALQSSEPAWSPDGTMIAFTGLRAGEVSVYRIAARGGRLVRVTNSRDADLDVAWQPAVAITPAPPATPLGTPPSVPTTDARAVGVLLDAFFGLLPVLDLSDRTRADDVVAAARVMLSHSRLVSAAAAPLRPASSGARSARHTVLRSMTALKNLAADTRRWARSVRRHRHAARQEGRDVVLTLGFSVLLPIAAALGDVEFPQSL